MYQFLQPRISPMTLKVFCLVPLNTTVQEPGLRRLTSPRPHQNLRKYGRVTGVVQLAVDTQLPFLHLAEGGTEH